MDEVGRRYIEFCRRFEQEGYADPRPALEGLAPPERGELAALIEAYLASAPPQAWDPEAFEASPARGGVDELVGELLADTEPARDWSRLLPELRQRARLRRDRLAEILAERLGYPGEADRVRFFYHHMERGSLPPGGVSDAVLEALAGILDTTREALRRAGDAGGQAAHGEPAPVFARTPSSAPEVPPSRAGVEPEPSGVGQVDRLFTEGRGSGNG